MANKFPLILNTSANQIQEIASGDNLDLTGCGINNAGVITATSFSGNGAGLIGVASTDYILTGTAATFTGGVDINSDLDVDGHTNLDNISVAGVSTFAGAIDLNADIDVDGHTNLDNVSIAGVSTFTGAIDANGDLDVDGHTNLDNVSIAGVTTMSGNITATGNLTISNTAPWIQFTDTNTNPDWLLQNSNGAFVFHDGTATRLQLNTDGHVDVTGNLDVGAGVDVTGNVVASGNVTAVDGTFTGNVSIGGTLTYEDVTNIDSVGLITARNGVSVTSGGIKVLAGTSNFNANIVGTATTALSITAADESSDTSCNVLFATAATGNVAPKTGSNLTFNSSTGLLVASGFSGDGSSLTGLNASNLGTGTVPTARLGSGTANNSVFLRGDNTWVAIAGGVDSDSDENTVGGTGAGANFTGGSGLKNTCFGKDAGNDITSGDFNVAIGHQTLDACNTGRFNTAVGNDALGGLTSGVESTAFGYNAGLGGNGGKNVFMGYSAGQSVTSSENTIIGYEAGKANNTNGKLVAFGMEAAHNSTSAQRLTALGYQAGRAHTGGNGNTYVGYQAGMLNGNGDMNCVMGDQTVRNSSDFNRATVFGAYAAGGFGSNANDNTVIGYNAGSSSLTGTNNVIIGSGANLSGNVSNEITLGNASITKFRIPGIGLELTGPVGITTEQVTPSSNVATLNLAKDDHKIVASGTYTVNVSGGTEAGSHTLRIENSGTANVGFSTYFKFPSGGTPSLPTASGAISLISFTVHKVGSVGIATVLLAGASVNYS